MKIVFFGDSITDAWLTAEDYSLQSYGCGFVHAIASQLMSENPTHYQILNRGIGGNNIADLYARVKMDVWLQQPDVISILVGINDVCTDDNPKGIAIERFEQLYRMLLEDTKKHLPNTKIILCEPFALQSGMSDERYAQIKDVYNYAAIVKALSAEYKTGYVFIQEKLSEMAKIYGDTEYLCDGVHPTIVGAKLIADAWYNEFKTM